MYTKDWPKLCTDKQCGILLFLFGYLNIAKVSTTYYKGIFMDLLNDRLEFCRRIAVMGGTFDPFHYGHLAMAEAVHQAYKPDKILIIPLNRPAHREDPVTDGEHRYRMAVLAAAEHPFFTVSRMELDRPGTTYTIDTVRTLRHICPDTAEIYFIVGEDAVNLILDWKDVGELFTLCRFIVIPRPGGDKLSLHRHIEMLRSVHGAHMELLDIDTPAISATDIRERMASGRSVRYLLPRVSEDYAKRNGLYNFKTPSFEECRHAISAILSPKRYAHTMGVVEEAERLAHYYGADVGKAKIAALLHDCAKEYSADKKRALCEMWNIPMDDILHAQIDLTHSLLGAESAWRDYNVYDGEILQAIRYHTTGHKNMTLMDKIILLADYIEPTRDDYPGLSKIREQAYVNLNSAILTGIRATIRENKIRGRAIHPWSKEAIKELKKGLN
jgi:nicotinate-nucleotide adenylyltransferase